MSKLFAAVLASATLSLAVAPVAFAETATPAAPAAAAKYNGDTPIETIVANPEAKAALDKIAPGITTHPMYDSFKGMSLRALAPYSEGKLSDDAIKAIETALAAVKS
jgi:hypothetical protein